MGFIFKKEHRLSSVGEADVGGVERGKWKWLKFSMWNSQNIKKEKANVCKNSSHHFYNEYMLMKETC